MRHFTGNPFVDAGTAAMCAAAEVEAPEQLDMRAVRKAVDTLYRIVLSDSAFVKKEPYKVFATSTMSMLFPNSPLPQASFTTPDRKRQKYRERVEELLELIGKEDASDEQTACFACGQPASLYLGIDRFPLMGSKELLNFHPFLSEGHPVCAFCALAVQFLPLAVLQTKAEGGRLWFVHTVDASVAVTITKEYCLPHMERLVAAGEPLRFMGSWACEGESGAIVSLLNEMARRHATLLEQTRYPVSVFLFSNDNREQFLRRIPIAHQLLVFFNLLTAYGGMSERFAGEVLRSGVGTQVAARMLQTQPLMSLCLQHDEKKLRGGWTVHALYAMEVLGMSAKYVLTLQEVARRLAADEKVEKTVDNLRIASTHGVFSAMLQFVREGKMSRQELQVLVPPGEAGAVDRARDYLLGALYALRSGEDLQPLVYGTTQEEARHPLVEAIERAGEALLAAKPDEAKRLLNNLRQAARPRDIRGAFLRLLAVGGMSWNHFLFFCPPDDVNQHYQSRDYWLAFLYDRLREQLTEQSLPEEQTLVEEV